MKSSFYSRLIFVLLIVIFSNSCKKEEVPTLTTTEITNITGTTASCGGNITDEGTSTVLTRGVCWSISTTPTIVDNKTTDGAGAGSFSSNLTGLSSVTNYFVRAYATNSEGTGYGMAMSFTTLGQVPSAITQSATNVTTTSATLNSTVNANYLSTTVTFEYGTATSYGLMITSSQSPASGNSNTNATAEVTGLIAGTTYHFRVKTVNSLGTTYGNDITFTTLGQAPTASTQQPTNITLTSATLKGSVNANYLSTSIIFEYGTTTSYGNTITALQSPATGNTSTNVSANISELNSATIYHFRIKAVNSLGTTYGEDKSFTTLSALTSVTDIDGNIYGVVTIGSQVWLTENLKTTKFNDNTDILLVPDATAWSKLSTPGYCYHNNNPEISYGAYYNWFAVNTGKLCPTGWHVPSNSEWTTLDTFLGGVTLAGPKLMETGTVHWSSPNTVATNESGFTALPGGYRNGAEGNFYGFGTSETWVTSTEYSTAQAYIRSLYDSGGYVVSQYSKKTGYSIRCIKD